MNSRYSVTRADMALHGSDREIRAAIGFPARTVNPYRPSSVCTTSGPTVNPNSRALPQRTRALR